MHTNIDGLDYQMPFVDRLVTPIMPDEATRMAALRTGKIDFAQFVPPTYWNQLKSTKLKSATYSNSTWFISMLESEPPFNDLNVRKALMIATDIKALERLNFAEDIPRHSYPIHYQSPFYIPEDKLPADIQELYHYDPEKAKQMLADAGYPDGLKIDLYADSTNNQQDNAALLKDMWAKAGVTADIQVHDPTTHTNFTYNRNYHGVIMSSQEIANPINSLNRLASTEGYINFSGYSNKDYDALMAKLTTELDPTKQAPLIKEAQLMLLRAVVHIPFSPLTEGHFWWPWLRNYYGEVTVTDGSPHSLVGWIWLDQNMKKSMGF
jgi:peptide/nickel transport system substrate-binding protein